MTETNRKAPWEGSLCETAKAELLELKERYGITPTTEQVVWLNDLARKLQFPDPPSPAATGKPAHAGNGVWLWPHTLQSSAWWMHVEDEEWFFASDMLRGFSHCFALANARVPEFFRNLYDHKSAVSAVDAWWRNSPATAEGLLEALRAVSLQEDVAPILEDSVDNKRGDEDTDLESSDRMLALMHLVAPGADPNFWEWAVSKKFLLRTIETANEIDRADGEKSSPPHHMVIMTRRLGEASIAIRRWHATSQ